MKRRYKKYLIRAVTRQTGQPLVVVSLIVDTLADTISQELAKGNTVTWTGFGTWEPKERRSLLPGSKPFRGERSPSQWGTIRWVVFRAGQALRRLLRDADVDILEKKS